MEIYKLDSVDDLTPQNIKALIKRYKTNEVPRIKRLFDYYKGNSDIKKRMMEDANKPNNKIDTNFSSYIADTINGYFMGKPVNYQAGESGKMLLAHLQLIMDKNHEETHNQKVAKSTSIAGIGYELLYTDDKGNIRFKDISPLSSFLIYDTSIEENVLAGVWFEETMDYVKKRVKTIARVYTDSAIKTYEYSGASLKQIEEQENLFKEVPLHACINNTELIGDFERIMDLQDAYNSAVSNTANDLDYFSDSYLIIKGLEVEDDEELRDMKNNKIFHFEDSNGDVKWLTKSDVDMNIENYKDRLEKKIVQISGVPDLSSESFGANLSSIAIRMKMLGLEQKVAIKENFYSEFLEKRIQMITNILNLTTSTGSDYDESDVTFVFKRNLPVNLTEESQWALNMKGILSHETILANLAQVDDVENEVQKINKEQEDSLPIYTDFGK